MKPFENFAIRFATALVGKRYDEAYEMLSPCLRKEFTPDKLRAELFSTFEGYAHSEPSKADVEGDFSVEEWPAKRPGDVGWAYVSILGDDFVEGVTVVVTDICGELLIRAIDWGRP